MRLKWALVCAALLGLLIVAGLVARRHVRRKALEAARRARAAACRDPAANTIYVQLHGPVTEGALVRLFESAACPQRIRVGGATPAAMLARYAAYAARQGLPSYREHVRGAYGGERWVLVLHASSVSLAPDWDERMVRMAADAGEPLDTLAILMAGGFPVAAAAASGGVGVGVRMTRLAQQPKQIKPLALFWTPQCTFSSAAAWRGTTDPTDPRTGPRMWLAGVNFYLPNDASIATATAAAPTLVQLPPAGAARTPEEYARFVGVDFDTGEISARAALGLVSTDVRSPRLDEVLFKFGSLKAFEAQRDALLKVH